MTKLNMINITNCPISELEQHVFENVINLEKLALAGNFIEKLSNETFHKLSNVKYLYLQHNLIKDLPEGVLCDMPSLDYLVLWNCTKSSDYSYFEMDENGKKCNFPNLQSLHLMGNKLNYIPRRLPLFGPNLTTLDISHNKLEYDSLELLFDLDTPKEEEGNFPNIRFLAMGHNLLKKLPRMCPLFGPNLTILDLSHNLLESVSMESFDKAQNLESLYLHGNRLTSFDYLYVCDGLKNLKWVVLQNNLFNATFYGNMSKFLDDNKQRLIEMNKRILI
nr:leucine-rich repeat-containing protein 15-like [Drosophila kikkawai]